MSAVAMAGAFRGADAGLERLLNATITSFKQELQSLLLQTSKI